MTVNTYVRIDQSRSRGNVALPVCDTEKMSSSRTAPAIRTPRRRTVDEGRRESLLEQISSEFLSEGFTTISVDELTRRLHCSKSTIYSVAPTKEQLVVAVTKRFFRLATTRIEESISGIDDPGLRISAYLKGVGAAMSEQSPTFYQDMVSFGPTAEVYTLNSAAAARRVQSLIQHGVDSGHFRDINTNFAGHLIGWAIEGIHSGRLPEDTGLEAGQAFSELGDILLKGLGRADSSQG